MVEEKKLTRCFIAIDFNDDVIKEIARVQELLGKKVFHGKMTEPENLHLTLKFLGEIDGLKLEKVRESLREIKFKGFIGHLGEIGTFSYHGNPRIVWIKVNGKEVWDLQKLIDVSLKDLFGLEERFMSHLTVARIRYAEDKEGFNEYVGKIGVKRIKFPVKSFKLMKSELDEIGPRYSVIEEYELGREI